MLRRIVTTALAAGLAAGLFVSALQAVTLIPLIHEAEAYEEAAPAGHGHDGPGAAEAWAPAEGLERTAFTVLTNLLTAVGFALLLSAGFALAGGADARSGVMWGAAGFAAFHLAPALGLPPELPGTMAAELSARQAWWLGTAAATAGGLALLAFAPGRLAKVLGAGLLAVPHVIGAPAAQGYGGAVPPGLAAHFAAASLAVAGAFWAVLGGLAGFLFQRAGARA